MSPRISLVAVGHVTSLLLAGNSRASDTPS